MEERIEPTSDSAADFPGRPGAAAKGGPSTAIAVVLGWMIPGAGHLYIGRVWPAAFVAGSVLPLFVGGMALAGFTNVNPVEHPWMFAAQACCALPAGLAALFTRTTILTEPALYQPTGELYTAIAGLLNLVAAADVYARCRHGDPVPAASRPKAASEIEEIERERESDLVAGAPAAAPRSEDSGSEATNG